MFYDMGLATTVFDNQGRRSNLVFHLEGGPSRADGSPIPDDERQGRVALDLGSGRDRFENISRSTTWAVAKSVIGSLRSGQYRGPNVPADFNDYAADADVIIQKLRSAGLA